MPLVNLTDLQVLIPTFNRPEMLKSTLESVLCQSAGTPFITVLDNGTLPATKNTVDLFSKSGVRYYNSSSLGRIGNFILAQQVLSRKYALLLHDDDQLHPNYLALVLKAINAHPNATLVTCDVVEWVVGTEKKKIIPHNSGHVFTQQEFATFIYNSERPSFSFAVYAAESYKKLNLSSIFEIYGKWGDTPLMIEAVGNGKALMFMDTCGWAGVHAGQDSGDRSTLPLPSSWINLEKQFCKYMGDNPHTFSGLSFCLMNYRHLRSGFKRRIQKGITFRQYLRDAKAEKALTERSLWFRFVSRRIVQNAFLWLSHRHFMKSARPLF